MTNEEAVVKAKRKYGSDAILAFNSGHGNHPYEMYYWIPSYWRGIICISGTSFEDVFEEADKKLLNE